jgi:hypothetical protein
MCRVCEGFSFEDVLLLDAAAIAEYGYIMSGVTGDPDEGIPPWLYTVGLLDIADHPEMIVAGPPTESSARVVHMLAGRVIDGEQFMVGDVIDIGFGKAEVGAVHPVQYELDTFNVWHELQRIGAVEAAELTAVQIFLPDEMFCDEHREMQPVLADVAARVDHPRRRPNRAERRRRRKD